MLRRTILGLVLSLLSCQAANGDADECSTGSECPSGACQNGSCVVVGTGGAAGSATGGAAGAIETGGTSAGGSPSGGTSGSIGCTPNHDGAIEREEVPLQSGLAAKFLVSGNTNIASAGVSQPDGSRIWDLALDLGGDHLALVETQSLTGKWFESKFPGATYAARLSESSDLLGVFEVGESSLTLRGVVSPTDGLMKTELVYSPAVLVLDFALVEGKNWSTTSTVTGVAQGVTVLYTEKYENFVDAHGSLETPYGSFPVLRTRVVLTRTVGVLITVVRSYLFSTECFGTVASIVAKDNEPNVEISSAAEVRRLSP
jgi:hypothetical protein